MATRPRAVLETEVLTDLVILDGSTFFVSEPNGDVAPDEGARGFFFADTRHLSRWELRLGDRKLHTLTSSTVGPRWGRIFATLPEDHRGIAPLVTVRRDRLVGLGLHEDLVVENLSDRPLVVRLELRFEADFSDIFEVKGHRRMESRTVGAQLGDSHAVLDYRNNGYARSTAVWFRQPAQLAQDRATFEVALSARGRWQTCVEVSCHTGEEPKRPDTPCPTDRIMVASLPSTSQEWIEAAPSLETSHDALGHTYQQSLTDLAALRFRPFGELAWALPAAGLPWFMALFGRDSLITAYQTLPFQPTLARSTLEALATQQATDFDDFREAEPGKILHELRRGELASSGLVPHSPYYGSHDSTPLFLILLDEYVRWSGDLEFARTMEAPARAALEWVRVHGDLDGDGYLEYRRRSARGLLNQCWKDSGNSMLYADGRQAEGPIATCEIQGYAYDARTRVARVAREAWGDPGLADELEQEAATLRRRFLEDFWVEERGHFALALDGEKRPVDSLTSNIGHLLWSGIVDDDRAARTAERLMGPVLNSGWGIRTMSEADGGYSPMEYHNGTIWPHDSSLIAEGLRRYGFAEEAAALALSIVEAAAAFDYRLPELFAGFSRRETLVPVEYPDASRPQAWASGAPLLAVRTLMGLDPEDDTVVSRPWIPEDMGWIALHGVPGPSGRVDFGR